MRIVDPAGFCDRQVPVLSTLGRGPKGEKGDTGDTVYPTFADEPWSIDTAYSKLTVVLYEGNSYTAKQDVPVGIDIYNTDFWVETGNYNEQIEQYRQEVNQYRQDTFDAIRLIENKIELVSPYLQGSSVYLRHNDKTLLFDCGDTTDGTRMEDFLSEQDFDALDCVVITHFDHDHYGSFATVAKYCDADTDILIQMEPPEGTDNHTSYQNGLTEILQYVQQYELKTPRMPYEGEIITYDDISIELHNTTLTNRDLYESVDSESTLYNDRHSTLNNYSLIGIVDINGYIITYSGDIEAVAQRLNTQYMRKSMLAFVPHHISGISGYLPWYMKQAPQQWLGTTAASVFGQDIYVNNRYVVKMIRYNYMSDVIMTHNESLVIEVANGIYSVTSGESLIASMADEDKNSVYTVFYQIIPPSYETDNPFVLYDISLADLVSVCHLGLVGRYSMSPNITGRADMQVFKDLKKLMYNTSAIDSLQITITTGRCLDIEVHSDTTAYDHLVVYETVNPDAHTGYRLINNQTAWKHVIDNPQSGQVDLRDILSAVQLASLFRSKSAYVVLQNGLFIPLSRTENNSTQDPNMGASSLGGVTVTGGQMQYLARAWISSATNLATVTYLNLSTNAVTEETIAAIGVM